MNGSGDDLGYAFFCRRCGEFDPSAFLSCASLKIPRLAFAPMFTLQVDISLHLEFRTHQAIIWKIFSFRRGNFYHRFCVARSSFLLSGALLVPKLAIGIL